MGVRGRQTRRCQAERRSVADGPSGVQDGTTSTASTSIVGLGRAPPGGAWWGSRPTSISGRSRAALICAHVPLPHQRSYHRQHVVGLPRPFGISRHLAPLCRTQRIASTARRRSVRAPAGAARGLHDRHDTLPLPAGEALERRWLEHGDPPRRADDPVRRRLEAVPDDVARQVGVALGRAVVRIAPTTASGTPHMSASLTCPGGMLVSVYLQRAAAGLRATRGHKFGGQPGP